MQVTRDQDWYQIIRITGPSHNLLALRLDGAGDRQPAIERLLMSGEATLIEGDDVQEQVLEGVHEANAQFGTNCKVTAIRFVATDTPSSGVYRTMAKAIVEYIAQERTFVAV